MLPQEVFLSHADADRQFATTVTAMMRLLEERDVLRQAHLDDIRQAVQQGNAQLARGEGLPGAEVFESIRAKSQARRRAAQGVALLSRHLPLMIQAMM